MKLRSLLSPQVEGPNLPHRPASETALCSTAKSIGNCQLRVIFDRFSGCCLPAHVRFPPEATEMLDCRKKNAMCLGRDIEARMKKRSRNLKRLARRRAAQAKFRRGGIVAALRRSLLVGVNWYIKREVIYPRDVDL